MIASADDGPKAKNFPLIGAWPWCSPLSRSCLFILSVNWLMQGMRGMQRKELSFRIAGELTIAVVCFLLLIGLGLPSSGALAVGLAIAHTFNFTLNGQFWVCARYCTWYRLDPRQLDLHTLRIVRELRAAAWIEEAVVIGSLASSNRRSGGRSDIDLRIVFPDGPRAWWRINLLLLRLRCRAFATMIPLDLYAYDHPDKLKRFNQREPLAIILDRRGRLGTSFGASRRRVTLQ